MGMFFFEIRVRQDIEYSCFGPPVYEAGRFSRVLSTVTPYQKVSGFKFHDRLSRVSFLFSPVAPSQCQDIMSCHDLLVPDSCQLSSH
jgi:hypothetical protein